MSQPNFTWKRYTVSRAFSISGGGSSESHERAEIRPLHCSSIYVEVSLIGERPIRPNNSLYQSEQASIGGRKLTIAEKKDEQLALLHGNMPL